jgi:hypothetical protein
VSDASSSAVAHAPGWSVTAHPAGGTSYTRTGTITNGTPVRQ